MDWKIFGTTFVSIFLAEMGDKTQFAAVAAGAASKSVWPVLLGVTTALCLAGALGVLAGHVLGSLLNPSAMKWASGALFIAVGVWILISPAGRP